MEKTDHIFQPSQVNCGGGPHRFCSECFYCNTESCSYFIPHSSVEFTVKDSGKREEYKSGMVRDVADDKINYALCYDGPMFARWAEHLTKGAKKYAPRNWMQAEGEAEYLRAKESAARHFIQWWFGETDEDHAAAVFFNINVCEYVKAKVADEDEGIDRGG